MATVTGTSFAPLGFAITNIDEIDKNGNKDIRNGPTTLRGISFDNVASSTPTEGYLKIYDGTNPVPGETPLDLQIPIFTSSRLHVWILKSGLPLENGLSARVDVEPGDQLDDDMSELGFAQFVTSS